MRKITKVVVALMLTVTAMAVAGCTKSENEGDVEVSVTTLTPTNITQTSADLGVKVSFSDGVEPEVLGVCWGLSENPTVSGNSRFTENCNEPFVCSVTDLEPNTIYHVRAYFRYQGQHWYSETAYGEDITFTTETNITFTEGTLNGYTWVDLGLPSGTLWATCNVGADEPWEIGYYVAWGETGPESTNFYNWETYKYGINGRLTKYCSKSQDGYNGFTDNLTVLEASDDAATVNWGMGWRTPTYEELKELSDNTSKIWTTENGVQGWRCSSSNGGSIFLPAGGYYASSEINLAGCVNYWSSSLKTDLPMSAHYLIADSDSFDYTSSLPRRFGANVRPVCNR